MWLKTGPGPSSFSSSLHFDPPESFPFLDVKLFFSAFLYFPVSCKGLVPDLPAPVGPSPGNCHGDVNRDKGGAQRDPRSHQPQGTQPCISIAKPLTVVLPPLRNFLFFLRNSKCWV